MAGSAGPGALVVLFTPRATRELLAATRWWRKNPLEAPQYASLISRLSIWVATLNRLSARRKKPSRRRGLRSNRRCWCSTDSELRVANRMCFDPPSALNPAAIAIASTSGDLPEPLSPTRNVTFGSSSSVCRSRTAGIENG
jgi:hypothetical protein